MKKAKITRTQQILIDALKASLFGCEFCFSDDTDWTDVIAEAKAQAVTGLISSIIPLHDHSEEQCKANYLRVMYEQDRLVKLLDAAGVPCVVLKGSAAAIYYPQPYLRSMGDVDILVQRDRFIETSALLKKNGYVYLSGEEISDQSAKLPRHISFLKNGIVIELHHHFSSPGYDIDEILETAILKRNNHDLTGYRFPMLPDVENGLVLIGHINQHLKENGLGLRQIIDWMMYLHSVCENESWEKDFVRVAQQSGLLRIAAYITRMCNDYLGLPELFCMCRDVDGDLSEELLSILLTDGNLGKRDITSSSKDERRMRSVFYSIKRHGFINYFTNVGLGVWSFGLKSSLLKPLAFFVGLFIQIREGFKALIKNKRIVNHMGMGMRRYELYKIIGVRTWEQDE